MGLTQQQPHSAANKRTRGRWASANSSLTRTTSGRPTGEAAQAQVTRASRHLSRGRLYGSSWALAVPVRVLRGCGLLPSSLGLKPPPLFRQGIFQTSIAMVRSGQSPGIKPEDRALPHSTLTCFSPCRAGHQPTLVYPLLILCTDRGRAGGGSPGKGRVALMSRTSPLAELARVKQFLGGCDFYLTF